MTRPAVMHVDLDALQHNFSRVRALAPNSKIIAMVKANAYGHGAVRVAQTLVEADAFGVACLSEAVELRRAGLQNRIILMSGFFEPDELQTISELGVEIVVHQFWQIDALRQVHIAAPIKVWLKINLGMNRLGFVLNDFGEAYTTLSDCKNIIFPINLMTHFAEANVYEKTITEWQIKKFYEITRHLPGEKSLANSAGILAFPEAHADWVRPVIMLYGASPFEDKMGYDHDLKPVMTLTSQLMAITQCKKGDRIGYGRIYQCEENMPVGVVAIGYGDGYPRHAKNGTPVLVNDTICPLVGCVSMDMITVDLRPCTPAKVGDFVVLWGNDLPIEYVAKAADTIPYELLCHVKRAEITS